MCSEYCCRIANKRSLHWLVLGFNGVAVIFTITITNAASFLSAGRDSQEIERDLRTNPPLPVSGGESAHTHTDGHTPSDTVPLTLTQRHHWPFDPQSYSFTTWNEITLIPASLPLHLCDLFTQLPSFSFLPLPPSLLLLSHHSSSLTSCVPFLLVFTLPPPLWLSAIFYFDHVFHFSFLSVCECVCAWARLAVCVCVGLSV